MKVLIILAALLTLPACSGDRFQSGSDEMLETRSYEAIQAGDFGRAIDFALTKANAGDAEFQFSVGFSAILWLEAPSPKDPPRYSLEESIRWIRRAAAQDLPQAAGFLRAAYEWGRYSFPKSSELEACWQRVESAEQRAAVCFAAESKTQSVP